MGRTMHHFLSVPPSSQSALDFDRISHSSFLHYTFIWPEAAMRTHAPSSGLAYIHPHVAMSKDTSNLVSGPDVASAHSLCGRQGILPLFVLTLFLPQLLLARVSRSAYV